MDESIESHHMKSPNWGTDKCCGVTKDGNYCNSYRKKPSRFCQYINHQTNLLNSKCLTSSDLGKDYINRMKTYENHEQIAVNTAPRVHTSISKEPQKIMSNSGADTTDKSCDLRFRESPNWGTDKCYGVTKYGKYCNANRKKPSWFCHHKSHQTNKLGTIPTCSPRDLREDYLNGTKIYENHKQIDIYTGNKIVRDYEIDHIFECQLGALAINQTFKLPSSTNSSDLSIFATKDILKDFINHDNNLAPTSKYINHLKYQGVYRFCDDVIGNDDTKPLLTYLEQAKHKDLRDKRLKRKESVNIRKQLYGQCKRAQDELNDNGDSGMFVEFCSEIIQEWIPILKLK